MPEDDSVDSVWPREYPVAEWSERIRWRMNRLRCMTPAEIRHRLRRALAIRAERWGAIARAPVPAPDLANAPRPWIHAPAGIDPARYLQAAERAAAGRFDVFALQGADLGSPPRWNRDPKTGMNAPLAFGKLLDYRNEQLVGDVKYLWEINRHHHIVTLAQAFALSADRRHVEVIREHLESWFGACPDRMGPNWSSALEASIRLINWSVAWQLLGSGAPSLLADAEGGGFRRRWLESVFRHMQFVRGYYSRHSSANNHLIGEAAGVYVAAMTWPCWPEARAWTAEAKAILEGEAVRQNAPDGVNREQSVSYQKFEIELLLYPLLAARANGQKFSPAYESRIEAMLEYLASIMDVGGNLPMIGDSDDGIVVRLVPGNEPYPCRSLLAIGAVLFRRGEFKAKAGRLAEEACWLAGERAALAFRQADETRGQLPVRRAFPIGGYYVLGCGFETGGEIRLVVDAGPLGYQSIAAHGHADALSFTLSVGGTEIFVDPGTYAYHTQAPWRHYFRSTSAHNTVRIDGVDQSESGGRFMWLLKAVAGCSLWRPSAENDVFEGWHDGYTRLPDPVTHRRRITLEKRDRRLLIEDFLQMAGTHEVELFFHCGEQCRVDSVPGGYRIRCGERTVSVWLPLAAGSATTVHYGSTRPISGWVSRRFDVKQPAPTILWRCRLTGNSVLRSEIAC